jgi:hypothetical protein
MNEHYIHRDIGGWGVCPNGKSISVSVAGLRAYVRAKLCAGVKGTMVPPGARPKNWKFVGVVPCRAVPCPARPAAPPDGPNAETKSLILPHFIASGYSAQRAVCFLGVSIPKSLQNLVFVCCPGGLEP